MRRFISLTLLTLSLAFSSQALVATPVFSVSAVTPFPNQMVVNDTAVATYTITNNVRDFSGVTLQNLGGTTQVTGSSLCAAAPFALAKGASCTLKLQYAASSVGSVSGGPNICPDNTGVNCSEPVPAQQINFSVIANPSSDMPTLSVPSTLYLVPGETTVLTVSNPSTATQAANNVRVVPPANLSSKISSTDCDSVAPGSSCEIAVTTASSVSNVDQATFTVTGSNTQSSSIEPTLSNSLLSASAVSFSTPGTKSMTLTNFSQTTISVSSVSSSVSGVTAGDPSACEKLTSGSSCAVSFTAASNAYGTGNVTINYSIGGESKTATGALGVTNTTLSINDGNDLEVRSNDNVTYSITNTGNFAWQGASFEFGGLRDLVFNGTACTGTVLEAGDSCNISFIASGAVAGTSADITITGDNIAQTGASVVVTPGLTITLDDSAANTHLQDRAIKITNSEDTVETLPSDLVSISNDLSNKIVACPAGGSNCNYQSTCEAGGTLAAGASCLIWLESQEPTGQAMGAVSGTVTINASNLDSKTYDITYEKDLYAGGTTISTLGSSPIIERWNGTSWTNVANAQTANTDVNALHVYRGDLVAAGGIVELNGTELSHIGRWNGNSWFALGEDNLNDIVRALAVVNATLYVGGNFTAAGSISLPRIAAWSGSNWLTLDGGVSGGRVYSLALDGSILYVGGNFTNVGTPGITANGVATWDTSTGEWSGTNISTISGIVKSLSVAGSTVYAGGNFTNLNSSINYIAGYNNDGWSGLGDSVSEGTFQTQLSATAYDDTNAKLYVGGDFTKAGGEDANNVAVWDGIGWSALGAGLGSSVFTLALDGQTLYAGGLFTNKIEKWNDTEWSALSGDNDFNAVLSLTLLPRIASITESSSSH